MATYNRYSNFEVNGTVKIVPFISIPKQSTDYYAYYTDTRLDILSYNYYGDANYGWLILQANPEVGSMEFNIPEHTILRIPYPLELALKSYENSLSNYTALYGSN